MVPLRVLHLTGSPTSDFFAELSLVYARGCLEALHSPQRYEPLIAFVLPGERWSFPRSLEPQDIAAAEVVATGAALRRIADAAVDIAIPQMFCLAGMTDYRALLDLLRIPYLGNRPLQMGIAADKAKTRAIVAQAGVATPRGELLRPGEPPTLAPPVVVKPNTADNSEGTTLVTERDQFAAALAAAFEHSPEVLVEEYIALGREVRCGIIERGGEMQCLPLEEYYVDPVLRPIRLKENKLQTTGSGGSLTLAAKKATQSWMVDPADAVTGPVWAAAERAYVALGCRQYGLFDFRIDPQGQPWFLEAGLYNSYSPKSVVATMAAAAGISLDVLFDDAVRDVLGSAMPA